MVSQVAFQRGWEYLEPLTLPGWDLEKPQVQAEALRYFERSAPDLLVVAWPCSPWSQLQQINQRTRAQTLALQWKRARSRATLLRFTREIVLRQRRAGRAVIGENPASSLAWRTPEILDAFTGCAEAVCDQCQYGLQHPEHRVPLKKRTRFMGQALVLAHLHRQCQGCAQHWPIEGGFRQADGRWASLSEWAGGYPVPLCQAILAGAEEYLSTPLAGAYVADDSEDYEPASPVRDEDLLDGEDAIAEEEQFYDQDAPAVSSVVAEDAQRHPIPREVAKAVEFAHRQLGHPSRTTLMRMLRLSGANDEAVRYAKHWRCDVCAQRAAPRHPQAAAPSIRPYGFNKHLHLDIKYVYDCRRKKYACLSILDLGTVKHDAHMVKTKKSSYIARKFFRHWIAVYGVPEKITTDQGGEFESTFNLYMEQMSIPTEVTAAHAGWQLAAGERHGGLLATILDAVVCEHGLEGFHQMKEGLAAAVAAKNGTLTRDGFTPNQRVYGTECRWPSLNDEDLKLSFAEGISVDSEVSRAHRMRTVARIALIRQDVRDKLRRAVLRKPAVSQSGPFVPGAQVYFWVPNTQKQTRYKKGGEWRGPATIITREKMKRYFTSWRGRLLLLAEENLRLATKEELALTEPVRDEMMQVGDVLRDASQANVYKDLRAPPPQRRKRRVIVREGPKPAEPEDERKARLMMRGSRTLKRLMADTFRRGVQLQRLRTAIDRRKRAALEPGVTVHRKAKRVKALQDEKPPTQVPPAGPGDGEAAAAARRPEEIPVPGDDVLDEEPDEPNTAPAAEPREVPAGQQWDWYLREQLSRPAAERRLALQDDVPTSIRKRLHADEVRAWMTGSGRRGPE